MSFCACWNSKRQNNYTYRYIPFWPVRWSKKCLFSSSLKGKSKSTYRFALSIKTKIHRVLLYLYKQKYIPFKSTYRFALSIKTKLHMVLPYLYKQKYIPFRFIWRVVFKKCLFELAKRLRNVAFWIRGKTKSCVFLLYIYIHVCKRACTYVVSFRLCTKMALGFLGTMKCIIIETRSDSVKVK
jgi:hypothetical protein